MQTCLRSYFIIISNWKSDFYLFSHYFIFSFCLQNDDVYMTMFILSTRTRWNTFWYFLRNVHHRRSKVVFHLLLLKVSLKRRSRQPCRRRQHRQEDKSLSGRSTKTPKKKMITIWKKKHKFKVAVVTPTLLLIYYLFPFWNFSEKFRYLRNKIDRSLLLRTTRDLYHICRVKYHLDIKHNDNYDAQRLDKKKLSF